MGRPMGWHMGRSMGRSKGRPKGRPMGRPMGRSARPCQPSPDWGTGLMAWFTGPINPVLSCSLNNKLKQKSPWNK